MWIWIIVLIVLVAIWLVSIYNGLIVLKNRVAEADSDIDVQLKRRHDLIPNLINTVKAYAQHESGLFERVTQARSQAVGANDKGVAERAQAENMLTSTLRSLFAVAENYPDLKANQNFLALQEELSDTENKIMSARRFYNTNVKDFNTRQEIFPSSLIAQMFRFKKSELFELTDITEREVPQVDFTAPPAPPVAPTPPPVAPSEPPYQPPTPPMPPTPPPAPPTTPTPPTTPPAQE